MTARFVLLLALLVSGCGPDKTVVAKYCTGFAGYAGAVAEQREAGWSRAQALDFAAHMHSLDNTPELRPQALDEVNKIYDDQPRPPAEVKQAAFDSCVSAPPKD